MNLLTALLSGLLFGLGILHSGMADPGKVLGFLDLFGNWDPSLALVMAGAIAVGLPAFFLARRRNRSLLDLEMQLPTTGTIDRRLVLGSLAFGIGWGLVGYCPGPAMINMAMGVPEAMWFGIAMLIGMRLFEALERRRQQRPS